jgi:hypothetical protein
MSCKVGNVIEKLVFCVLLGFFTATVVNSVLKLRENKIGTTITRQANSKRDHYPSMMLAWGANDNYYLKGKNGDHFNQLPIPKPRSVKELLQDISFTVIRNNR